MKKYQSILFDLDGTLTESGIGITRCAAYALDQLHISHPDVKELTVFVGPPLRETFPKFGVTEEKVDEAIRIFRSRYTTIGKYENTPYEGIETVLSTLKEEGYHLFVATSKPEIVAKDILSHFHLSHYFDEIIGASQDASRESKSAVIAYLLSLNSVKNPVMVGDTIYDVQGAKQHCIPCIGVSWGYGSKKEMLQEGAIAVVDSMHDLLKKIKEDA